MKKIDPMQHFQKCADDATAVKNAVSGTGEFDKSVLSRPPVWVTEHEPETSRTGATEVKRPTVPPGLLATVDEAIE